MSDDFDDLDELEEFDDLDEEEEERAAPKKKAAAKPTGIGARAVAEKLGADPKTFRAWLRRKVDAGEFKELADREPRSRYNWKNWKDPSLVAIMKAWKTDDHTKGGGLKKGAAKKKPAAKKAPAKKKPAARKRTAKK